MEGKIVDIQRFSTQDGPGIRTTVFFKGCNLSCEWCHNPETIDAAPAIGWLEERCVHCGFCAEACPEGAISPLRASFDSGKCTVCGRCAEACLENALNVIGETKSVEQVLRLILRDKQYYDNSGGGVTASGGEPMLQWAFVERLFSLCRENGVATALDTAGNVKGELYRRLMPVTDRFLFDIKIMDEALHKAHTGVSNRLILANLAMLIEAGAEIEIRIPVIGGVNDNEANMCAAAALLSGHDNVKKVRLLPYHSMGVGKRGLSRSRSAKVFETPPRERLKELAECFDICVEY